MMTAATQLCSLFKFLAVRRIGGSDAATQCRERTGGLALTNVNDFKEVTMAIIYDHEPDVRESWQRYERNRRIASHSEERSAVLMVMLVTLTFWLIVGFGLYMAF